MREIKFRAWINGKMHENIQEEEHLYAMICNKEFPIMQYTGLKDKNGKEIYEGDIVYLAGYGDYEVEFPFTELYEHYPEGDIGEIKGNIYENPELINQ